MKNLESATRRAWLWPRERKYQQPKPTEKRRRLRRFGNTQHQSAVFRGELRAANTDSMPAIIPSGRNKRESFGSYVTPIQRLTIFGVLTTSQKIESSSPPGREKVPTD